MADKIINGMYQRDSNKAFENAKSKGLDKPNEFMYMYSKDNKDFFKNIMNRKYISFEQPKPKQLQATNWKCYIEEAIKTGLESPTPYKVIPYKNGIGIKETKFIKPIK